MPSVQRVDLRLSRAIDYFLNRDFDPFSHHPVNVLYHLDRDFDSFLDDLLDNTVDILDHFYRDFDALLDEPGFYGRKQQSPDEAPRRGSDKSHQHESAVGL
jgi:hypothetical protein